MTKGKRSRTLPPKKPRRSLAHATLPPHKNPIARRPMAEFRTADQMAKALRITAVRLYELMNQGRLTPTPVELSPRYILYHFMTSYQRKLVTWTPGPTISPHPPGEEGREATPRPAAKQPAVTVDPSAGEPEAEETAA